LINAVSLNIVEHERAMPKSFFSFEDGKVGERALEDYQDLANLASSAEFTQKFLKATLL
jgi:hypothetical protein